MKMNYNNSFGFRSILAKFLILGVLLFSSLIYGQTATLSVDRNGSETAGVDSSGRFLVTVNGGVSQDANVSYNVLLSSSAVADNDYDALPGFVFMEEGQESAFIEVDDIVDDLLVEGDETITIQLTSGTGYFLPAINSSETLVIVDNDQALLSVVDTSAEEGLGLVFNITADKLTSFDYIVTINFAGGTATRGTGGLAYPEDYGGGERNVTFSAGEVSKQLAVSTLNDNVDEGDETFIMTLTSVDNANVIAGASAEGTIIDDDVASFTIFEVGGDTETSEPNFGQTFTVVLDNQPTADVYFDITSSDLGEATINNPRLRFRPNNFDTPQTVSVTGVDDNLYDGVQPYNITISIDDVESAVEYRNVADQIISATNLDDEVYTATITNTDPTATEGSVIADSGSFTIALNEQNATGNPITVNYTVSGTATSDTDYTALSGTAIIPNNQQSIVVIVTPLNDDLVENAETVIVQLAAGTNYVLGGAATRSSTVTINDTDAFTASVAATAASANENPVSNGVFTVDIGAVNQTGSAVVVNFTIGGTATETLDYSTLSRTVTIANGQRTGVVTVTPVNDTTIENNETVVLTIASGTGYTIASSPLNSAIVRIISDDANVARITASDATSAESNSTLATGEFTINLNAPNNTGSSITVNYVISGVAQNGVDYTAISANAISIPNGQQSAKILVAPINDQIQEGSENVIITLAAGSGYDLGATSTRTATVVIDDNDQATLTVSDITVNEDVSNGRLQFNVILDIAVIGGTTVTYSFIDDTATGGGVDYTGVAGSLTFTGTAGETKPINVPIINDQLLENTERFTLQLGAPTNGVQRANGGTAIGTINDDDNCVAAPILDASVSTIYCVDEANPTFSANLYDFTSTPAPNGTVLTWSRDADPLKVNSHFTPAEAQNITTVGSRYGFFYDAANNCASGTIEVEIVRNVIPILTDENITVGERCGPGTLLLRAVPSDGASINWYDTIDADAPIAFGQSFTTPNLNATRTYYVEATENGCSTERKPVIARIGFQASTGTVQNASICSVAINGQTTLDLDNRLTGADAGVWVYVSGPVSDVSINSTNVVDFEGLDSGDYIFRFTTTNSTAPCLNPTVDVTINVTDCESDVDEDGLLGGEEVSVGTDSNNPDTDGDGINDDDEVGPDITNPLDEDNDGIIDALDSNILDADNDGVNDQQDSANNNPCIPNRFNGSCDTDGDGLSDLDEQTNGSDPDDPCDPVASPNCDVPIDLEITKTVDNEDALIGDTVIFTIRVTNLSDRMARAIKVEEMLESGFEFVSKSTTDYDEVLGVWEIIELDAGLTVELSITVTILAEGPYTNTATLIESIPTDSNIENDIATVTLNTETPEGIDLAIVKSADNVTPLIGEEITFSITVENKSKDGETLTNIEIEDVLPNGADAGFVYVSNTASTGAFNEVTGRWSVESLAVGEQNIATLNITVTVPREGVFTNTATLIRSSPADSNINNNTSAVDITVSVPTPANPGFLFNQFSPNGDNTNDILRINLRDKDTGLDAAIQYKIKIYDRYGNLVFDTEKINDGDIWDGTYKGKEVPKGTYFYIMNYRINNDPVILDKGWIQLIR